MANNIINRIFGKKEAEEKRGLVDVWQNPVLGTLNFNSFNQYTVSKTLNISSVYRSVNLISDSVSVLELIPYQIKGSWKYKDTGNLYNLLNIMPNKLMNANTFKRLMVQYILLNGNAYIRITRNQNNEVQELTLMHPDDVQILVGNKTLTYRQVSTGIEYDSADVIHIMNYPSPDNGLIGISTVSYAALTLGTTYAAEEMANNWFSSGGVLSGILRPVAGVNLSKDKANAAKQSFLTALNSDLGGKSGSVVVLDSGLEYQSISINNKDMQLLESRQFNMQTIAHYFGVPLPLLDSSKSNYATQEAAQIAFLNSCLHPLLEKIELAFYTKLFLPVEYPTTELAFDVSNLLRLDAQTQATVYTQLFNIGALTVNEIREKLNSAFPVAGGNRAFVQQNVQPLDNILNDVKAGTNNNDNNTQQ